jgi:hypothetical protein
MRRTNKTHKQSQTEYNNGNRTQSHDFPHLRVPVVAIEEIKKECKSSQGSAKCERMFLKSGKKVKCFQSIAHLCKSNNIPDSPNIGEEPNIFVSKEKFDVGRWRIVNL